MFLPMGVTVKLRDQGQSRRETKGVPRQGAGSVARPVRGFYVLPAGSRDR